MKIDLYWVTPKRVERLIAAADSWRDLECLDLTGAKISLKQLRALKAVGPEISVRGSRSH